MLNSKCCMIINISELYWFLGYCATSQPSKGWTQTPSAWLLVCLWVKTCMLKKSFKLKYHLFVITMQNLGRQMYEMKSCIDQRYWPSIFVDCHYLQYFIFLCHPNGCIVTKKLTFVNSCPLQLEIIE